MSAREEVVARLANRRRTCLTRSSLRTHQVRRCEKMAMTRAVSCLEMHATMGSIIAMSYDNGLSMRTGALMRSPAGHSPKTRRRPLRQNSSRTSSYCNTEFRDSRCDQGRNPLTHQ